MNLFPLGAVRADNVCQQQVNTHVKQRGAGCAGADEAITHTRVFSAVQASIACHSPHASARRPTDQLRTTEDTPPPDPPIRHKLLVEPNFCTRAIYRVRHLQHNPALMSTVGLSESHDTTQKQILHPQPALFVSKDVSKDTYPYLMIRHDEALTLSFHLHQWGPPKTP